MFRSTQDIPDRDTVKKSLEASRKAEIKNLERLKDSQVPLPSGSDISEFIHLARSYGYIKENDREVIETLIDRIYISHRNYGQYFHKDQVSVCYKYVGVLPDKNDL